MTKFSSFRIAFGAVFIVLLGALPTLAADPVHSINGPTVGTVEKRVIAGEEKTFAVHCQPGYQIISGGYEITSVEGGKKSDVNIVAAFPNVLHNRYFVKLFHELPYTAGPHPKIVLDIYVVCLKSAGH